MTLCTEISDAAIISLGSCSFFSIRCLLSTSSVAELHVGQFSELHMGFPRIARSTLLGDRVWGLGFRIIRIMVC